MIPTDLSGLAIWLDASQLGLADGAAVSPWSDLSGQNNHGVIFGTPAPTVRVNALNGKSVVRFKTTEGRIRSSNPLPVGTLNPYNLTFAYVTRMVGPGIGRAFTAAYPGANYLVGFHTAGYECMYDNAWVNPGVAWPATPTPWKIYGSDGIHDGTNYLSRFFINGVVSGTNTGGVGIGTLGWNISGYDPTGTQETCDCEVAELVLYDHKLSEVERKSVEGYLYEKWLRPPPIKLALSASLNFTPAVGQVVRTPAKIPVASSLILPSSIEARLRDKEISLATDLPFTPDLALKILAPPSIPPKWITDVGLDDPKLLSVDDDALSDPELIVVRLNR